VDSDRASKTMVAGGLVLLVTAIVALFLFVLPALQSTGIPTAAQPAAGPGGAPGGPPGPGMMPGGGLSGGPPGMPGMPGPPLPGMPTPPTTTAGMGMGMGMGAAGGLAAPAGAAAPETGRIAAKSHMPLEPPRANPFLPVEGAAGLIKTTATKYGPDWSQIPITTRLGFTRPTYPRQPRLPELPEPLSSPSMRITGITWSGGMPLASYETKDGKTGVVGPGDIVDDRQVLKIGQDYVVVRNRKTNQVQRLQLRGIGGG